MAAIGDRRRSLDDLHDLRSTEAAKLNLPHLDILAVGCVTAIDMVVRYQSILHTNSFITDQEGTMVDPMKRLPELPAERALKVIAGRSKAVILYPLFHRPARLSNLNAPSPY